MVIDSWKRGTVSDEEELVINECGREADALYVILGAVGAALMRREGKRPVYPAFYTRCTFLLLRAALSNNRDIA